MITIEQLEARIAALEARLNAVPFRLTALRIDNPTNQPAIFIHQAGNSTGIVHVQDSDNPGIKVTANGNAACVELHQVDGEDAIEALGADIRCEQVILVGDAPHVALAPHGAIQWADPLDATEYYDAIRMSSEGVVIG